MKCPLCDGTVVNGRCKECGMPYRNDEILYHLNESRSDHYRHASDKARKIMQTQSAGVGSPGKGSARKAAGNRNTSSGREKIRPAKTKKHSKLGILWVIIIILAAVAPLAEDLGGAIKEAIQSEVENSSEIQTDTAETTDPGTYFYSWDDEQGYKDYSIGAGYGPAQAGVQFEAGKYGVFTSSAEVTLTVTRKKADNEQYTSGSASNLQKIQLACCDAVPSSGQFPDRKACTSDKISFYRTTCNMFCRPAGL